MQCNQYHGTHQCSLQDRHNGDHVVFGPTGNVRYQWENLFEDRRPHEFHSPPEHNDIQDKIDQFRKSLQDRNMNGKDGLRAYARQKAAEWKINNTARELSFMGKNKLIDTLTEAYEQYLKNGGKAPQPAPDKGFEHNTPEHKPDNSEPDIGVGGDKTKDGDTPQGDKPKPDKKENTGQEGESKEEQQDKPIDEPLAKVIAQAVEQYLKGNNIDEELVRNICRGELIEVAKALEKKAQPRSIKIEIPDHEPAEVGLTHYMFKEILEDVLDGNNVWITGPSGSGKTYLSQQVAEAAGLKFESLSVGMQTSKTDLFGYMDAHGNYIETSFYRAYVHGALFCLDEVDNGNANVIAMINAATSNDICSFPNGMQKKHEKFIMIACANTYGLGADAVYVGRNQIDGATRNRFAFKELPYDEDLEQALTNHDAWHNIITTVRRATDRLKEKVIVSPRASIKGARAIQRGRTVEQCLDMYVFQGVSTEVKQRIIDSANLTSKVLKARC